jgi:hypothetical protein
MLCAVLVSPAQAITSNTHFASAVPVTEKTAYTGVLVVIVEPCTGLFGADNPVNMVDPSGHDDIGDVLGSLDIFSGFFATIMPVTTLAATAGLPLSDIVYISVDPTGAPSTFNPSAVQTTLQSQLSANVFDSLPAGQSVSIKVHEEATPPGTPGWNGKPKHIYINRVDWTLKAGIASSARGETALNSSQIDSETHGAPTTQTYANILAHEVIWLNAGGHWDHDWNPDGEITSGVAYPFSPYTVLPSSRSTIRSDFGF